MKWQFIFIIFLALASCQDKAKVVSPSETREPANTNNSGTGIFDKNDNSDTRQGVSSGSHTVEVLEVLPTDKYVYMRVSEGNQEFWLATGKQPVEIGDRFQFTDGLLKTNFESKEYNRVFEKLYLVSRMTPLGGPATKSTDKGKTSLENISTDEVVPAEGSIAIADIIENPSKYDGKQVQVTGKCTKLNANIMGRHWIHLKDGSNDDYDFVVTSDQAIPEGHVVTMAGTISLDRDFGSGYRYEILMENATAVIK